MIRRPPRSTLFPYTDALPILYRARLHPCNHSDVWLFIQHGSYQWIRLAAQPHLEDVRRPDLALSGNSRSEEHTSELQSQSNLVCRLLLVKTQFINHDEAKHPP